MFNSHIQWTNATVNFWTGCTKVSEGCKYCYMYRDKERYGQDPTKIVRTAPTTFNAALKWKEPKKIFTNSWSDFFVEEADEWRDDAWDVIRKTPQHTWQILTKRPERISGNLPDDWGEGFENVWLGVSVEMQKYFHRAYILSQVAAKTRFISAEPLLEGLDVLQEIDGRLVIDDIDWIILGGESGNDKGKYRYRECRENWFKRIIDDVKTEAPHISVFVKQLGTYLAKQNRLKERHGGNADEWTQELRIREFPGEVH
jgi:protein gp37